MTDTPSAGSIGGGDRVQSILQELGATGCQRACRSKGRVSHGFHRLSLARQVQNLKDTWLPLFKNLILEARCGVMPLIPALRS